MLVSDISVSRNHASIIYKDGKFLIFDKNSKFGTLVQVNQPIEISEDKTIIQCGKTVVILSLKKEPVLNIPKPVGEPMEILASPETSSTTNEAEGESKTQEESEKLTRKREKGKRVQPRRYNIQIRSEKSDLYDDNGLTEVPESGKL